MTAKKEIENKLPQHYFAYNDDAYKNEIEDCIITECESAGLNIYVDEELAEQRGYDQAFVVENPYKNKLEKIKKILKTNVEIWNETQHDPVEEFKLLLEIINESEE